MHGEGNALIAVGSLLLLGLAIDFIGRSTMLPRVTLLLLCGVTLGPGLMDLLPPVIIEATPLVSDMALSLVGFLLGGHLQRDKLIEHGRAVLCISACVVLVTLFSVSLALFLAGVPAAVSLVLGAIATATAPAATVDVVRQFESRGPFSDTLVGIVAIDDAWGLIVFSVMLAFATLTIGAEAPASILVTAVQELGGSLALGLVLGVPVAFLSGRIRAGEPTLVEALGVVFLCGGLAELLQCSHLLASMVLGATVANLAAHHERAFHEIEDIEWPFLIMFFILTGAALELGEVGTVLPLVLGYIVLRTASRIAGAALGGRIAHAPPVTQRWMGLALLPQAGVANGMALVAGNALPALRDTLIATTILATIVFELVGPFATRLALVRSGEIDNAHRE